MTRDELKLAIAKALCEDAYPGCDYKPEGSAYPSTWETLQEGFIAQADVCLTAIEAAGVALMPVEATEEIGGVFATLKPSGAYWKKAYADLLAASPCRSAP